MRRLAQYCWQTFRKSDLILLLLCICASAFGVLVIASATGYTGNPRYVPTQTSAIIIGIVAYVITSNVDVNFLSEHRRFFFGANLFFLLLLIPFGTDNGTGNKSWLDIPGVPVDIQPAEVCKVLYILVTASVMASHQSKPSSPKSVLHSFFHLAILAGLNMVLSGDLGVTMIFVATFVCMAITAGINWLWFIAGGGLCVAAFPVLWSFLSQYQKNRILILFDPSIDPNGINERYHTVQSIRTLTGGGMTGQGLFQGIRTRSGSLYAQHTDYIFSVIGEELGYLACIGVILLLFLIVARCFWVGMRSPDYMRRLICFGTASALIFQIIINVGMCFGVMPVIGLTLPFISYGGSSIISLFAMVGFVSGVYARPSPASHERYIRPPYMSRSII